MFETISDRTLFLIKANCQWIKSVQFTGELHTIQPISPNKCDINRNLKVTIRYTLR